MIEGGRKLIEEKAVSGIMTLLLIGMLTLAFNIQPVKASGTIYIRADGSIDPLSAPISTYDNITYVLTDNIVGDVPEYSSAIVVERNGIVLDGADHTVQGKAFGNGAYDSKGILLFGISNATIRNMKIKGFYYGILLNESSENSVIGNSITNNGGGSGVWLRNSSDNRIAENNITGNSNGIWFEHSSDNNIVANNITANSYDGVVLLSSSNNTISGNIITGHTYGGGHGGIATGTVLEPGTEVMIWSQNNTIAGNNITQNSIGIGFSETLNNTVSGNIIANNENGITINDSYNNTIFGNTMASNGNGVLVWSVFYVFTNNTFYHNNFIDNTQQVHVEIAGYANVWDDGYPSGGNYWSDYTGVDLYSGPNQDYPSGSDGMGDSAYVIDVNNRDRYPLINRWVERTVGVKVGDCAKYTFEFSWNSTDPMDQPPEEMKMAEWYKITVLDVVNTTVTFEWMGHLKNGTERKGVYVFDINTGLGNGTYVQAFISANLNAGDRLIPSYLGQQVWCGWQIKETILRTYAGVTREVNHVDVTNWSCMYRAPYYNSTDNFYWDRSTGILCEQTHQETYEREGYVTSVSFSIKIVNTNMWRAPEMQVGVKAGDWIKYDYTLTGWPAGTPYPTWLKVEFLRVEGTSATVQVMMRMSDGTEQNATVPVDVVAGGEIFGTLTGFVIPANLTTGDFIFMTGYGTITLTGETTRTYAGANRTVVHANFSFQEIQLTYYWDKQTGVMVESSAIYPQLNVTATAKATETNIWQAQPIPTSISVYPFEITVPMDKIFTRNVTVANVTDLYVWQINLYFDPSILNCTGAWYPDDHVFAGKDIVSVTPVIDNVGGYILYGCCLLGEEETFNGSGTLCQIQFKAVLPGNSTLEFSGPEDFWPTYLLDFDLNDIPIETYDGCIFVIGGLYGDVNSDGVVDVRDIAIFGKAFGSYPGHARWNPAADLDGNGIINILDGVIIAKNFGKKW